MIDVRRAFLSIRYFGYVLFFIGGSVVSELSFYVLGKEFGF